jgi:glycosyltransferase involved in cell wall biosynthesis
MGRPELRLALESLQGQDYPAIEVIVVDATGGAHPPLPQLPWRCGHHVRLVGGNTRLPRAHAANVGLLAATGEWLCFLDDDDTYDSHFLSAMVTAARGAGDMLLVYGRSKMLREDGQTERLFGLPFNRAVMHYGPLFYWQSALISRRVVELGCRFDERFDVCEDRDFLAQIAGHSDFAFVSVTGFNYHPFLGTSGTAGANRDIARTIRFDSLLRAKTAGSGAYHERRSTRMCIRAIQAYAVGNPEQARVLFDRLLDEYPDDPNGLHGLARLEFEAGRLQNADYLASKAIDVNPQAAEYRLTRALIFERLGRKPEAATDAQCAAVHPSFATAAHALLKRLRVPTIGALIPHAAKPPISRLEPCICGSGRRYKQCCGGLSSAPVSAADNAVRQTAALFERGEASAAGEQISRIDPADLRSSEACILASTICRQLDHLARAYDFLARASQIRPTRTTGELLKDCCDRMWLEHARTSAYEMAERIRGRLHARDYRVVSRRLEVIHIVATLETLGGSEGLAANLYRVLSPHTQVRLWSTSAPLPGHYDHLPVEVIDPSRNLFPRNGTLVLAGYYFDAGDWWQQSAFDRVVIHVNVDLAEKLVHRMAEIEECGRHGKIDFVFPSNFYRNVAGLPGRIEYSRIDTEHFAPTTERRPPGTSMVIGRHGRDDSLKHHPNDPSLYRKLVARKHTVRVLGGSHLKTAFAGDPVGDSVTLLPSGSQDAREFLGGLDCFIYRKHPQWLETCGSVIFEAMAMALPVIVFSQGVGAAEVIEHGIDGILVETEEQALEWIDRLAADYALRSRIGQSARARITKLLQHQDSALIAHYLDPEPP